MDAVEFVPADFGKMTHWDWKSDEAWDAVVGFLKLEAKIDVSDFETRTGGYDIDSSIGRRSMLADTCCADVLLETPCPELGSVKIVDAGIYSTYIPASKIMQDVCVPEGFRLPTPAP